MTKRAAYWLIFWTGPVCWFLQQQVLFMLVRSHCDGKAWLSVVMGLAFALIPAGALAYGLWNIRRYQPSPQQQAMSVGWFGLVVGTITSALFLIVMIWQIAGLFLYSGCEH